MSDITRNEINEVIKRIDENVHDLKEDVEKVKVQTTKTNGSVKGLQLWKSKVEGALIILTILMSTILVPLALDYLQIHFF